MRVAVCSDEPYAVHDLVLQQLTKRGHRALPFGSLVAGEEIPWAQAAEEAAEAILRGECDEGIFFCWSGTGICIAANKLPGIRAALCADPETARAARIWNHANVLCLSNRLLSNDRAIEILDAWFDTNAGERGTLGVRQLAELEHRWMKG
jgi:ribose 5-phosphate isomerase B